ncbi:MAG: CusA/CzcA family heavy metal efflux RND transporter [Planctomycetaceae bacterium]
MIATLIRSAMEQRWIVLIITAAIMAFGVYSFEEQPIDAYPDISAQMVQVITVFPGRAPEEVERQVTVPVEIAMRNVPKVTVIRSRTIFGLSVVQMIFEEGTDSYWARQRVLEKLGSLVLPDGAQAGMGPLATAYGEVYRYELVSDGTHDLMELRTLNDWVVIPRLLRVPGVAEVANFGGQAKQFTIAFQPAQLVQYGLTLDDIVAAIQANNHVAGGSVLRRGGMSFVIRGAGALETAKQIEDIFVKSVGGTPLFVKDVAAVDTDFRIPSGIYSKDLVDESVEGITLMRRGENPSRVLAAVKEAAAELNNETLPEGVQIVPFYDRQHLVDGTLHTVAHSVFLGITLVMLVLLLFLGRPSMAFLVALTIPVSLLFALILMYLTDIPIGLLSIGAIDFGIIVDGAVIMAENIARHLGNATHREQRPNVFRVVLAAALEMERPVFFAVIIVVAAYLPLLSLTSIEGLLFRPMALTMVYALGGALLFSLFVVPVLAVIMFRHGYHEWENPVLLWSRPIYASILRGLVAARWLVLTSSFSAVAIICFHVAPELGIEFLPYMDEGVAWVRANFPEGTSLQQSSVYGRRIREIAMEFPDIRFVSAQAGRNDSGTDPFPASRLELMIGPKPRDEWKQFKTKRELLNALGKRLREEFPTTRFNFTQPIIDSVTEDTNGTSANLAVEFTGSNADILLGFARRTVDLLRDVPGSQDVAIEQEGPQPQLLILPDRRLCARNNVRIEDVTRLINTAMGGEPIGTLYEGERRFDIVAKLDRKALTSAQAIGRLLVFTTAGVPIPLGQVAHIEIADGQTLIARENGRKRITVRCDIVGRDQGGFVSEAQRKFNESIGRDLPAGVRVGWLGMFENLKRAQAHFLTLIPITIGIIFVLLWVTFNRFAALLVLCGIPFRASERLLAACASATCTSTCRRASASPCLFGVSKSGAC